MGRADYYAPGDWNAWCDECGFKYKASKLRKRYDGFMVCQSCWEPRHPSEMRRAKAETATPTFVRPFRYNFGEEIELDGGYLADGIDIGSEELGGA